MIGRANGKAKSQPRQSPKLPKAFEHDHIFVACQIDMTVIGANIGKAFVDHNKRPPLWIHGILRAGGVVGMHADHRIGRAIFGHNLPAVRGKGALVFVIAGMRNGDRAVGHKGRDASDQSRGAGAHHDLRRIWNVPKLPRRPLDPVKGPAVGQGGPTLCTQIANRIGHRIDPCREVNPIGARAAICGNGGI